VGRRVLDPNGPESTYTDRARWLLRFALMTSAVVVVFSSALITSFFVSDRGRTVAATRDTRAHGKPFIVALARTAGGSLEWRTYAVAISRMGRAIGRPMRVRYVDSRSQMSDLLLGGQVDAGFLCTYCYLQVAGAPGVSLLAAPVIADRTKDAATLVVRSGSRYRSLGDLRDQRVGVIDPTSLAGYAYLLWLADQQGMDTTASLSLVTGGSQEQNIRALLAGKVEAVVVNRSQLASWPTAGLRVLATSPEFGMPPFVTGPGTDATTRDTLQRALLDMRPSAEITPTSIQGFSAPTDSDYTFARVLERYTHPTEGAR
jgi:ABC-type phosphate/phosphonate transport system substrate-binding protein